MRTDYLASEEICNRDSTRAESLDLAMQSIDYDQMQDQRRRQARTEIPWLQAASGLGVTAVLGTSMEIS